MTFLIELFLGCSSKETIQRRRWFLIFFQCATWPSSQSTRQGKRKKGSNQEKISMSHFFFSFLIHLALPRIQGKTIPSSNTTISSTFLWRIQPHSIWNTAISLNNTNPQAQFNIFVPGQHMFLQGPHNHFPKKHDYFFGIHLESTSISTGSMS